MSGMRVDCASPLCQRSARIVQAAAIFLAFDLIMVEKGNAVQMAPETGPQGKESNLHRLSGPTEKSYESLVIGAATKLDRRAIVDETAYHRARREIGNPHTEQTNAQGTILQSPTAFLVSGNDLASILNPLQQSQIQGQTQQKVLHQPEPHHQQTSSPVQHQIPIRSQQQQPQEGIKRSHPIASTPAPKAGGPERPQPTRGGEIGDGDERGGDSLSVPVERPDPGVGNLSAVVPAGLGSTQRPTTLTRNLHGEIERIVQVRSMALLEEVDSDVTGPSRLTSGNGILRSSSVSVIKECQGQQWFRTADGTCNNLQKPFLGSAFQPFQRYLPSRYDDGVSAPRQRSVERDQQGSPSRLPGPRLVSRTVHLIQETVSDFSGMLPQFGQFLGHDITGTSSVTGDNGSPLVCCGENRQKHADCLAIEIPVADTHFTNSTCLNFVRSLPVTKTDNATLEPREQRNEVTSFLDASTVYGSTEDQTSQLRDFHWDLSRPSFVDNVQFSFITSTGLLKSSEGDLLPLRAGGCVSADGLCFQAGDARVNEMPGLSALHVLFLRQHNRLARALRTQLLPPGDPRTLQPRVVDEALFQTARRLLVAQWQHVVYAEWLPLVLGPSTLQRFGLGGDQPYAYDPQRDPRAANEFGASAFRFGHSLVPGGFQRGDRRLGLHQVFNDPSWVRQDVDQVLQAVLASRAQVREQHFVEGLRNRLFEAGPKRGLDLVAFNLQRGRDHGLAPYAAWRQLCGLPRVAGFNSSHLGTCGPALREVYLSVDDIDLFTGAVCEPSTEGVIVGPTLACLIGRQFSDLKYGDRFFYQTAARVEGFSPDQMQLIRSITFAELLCANSKTLESVQQSPFIFASPQNLPVLCSKYRTTPQTHRSLEAWRRELADLLHALSQSSQSN